MYLRIFLMASFLLSASSFLASIPPETIFINIRGEQIVEGGDNIDLGERTIGIYPSMTGQNLKQALQIAFDPELVTLSPSILFYRNIIPYVRFDQSFDRFGLNYFLSKRIGIDIFYKLARSRPVAHFSRR